MCACVCACVCVCMYVCMYVCTKLEVYNACVLTCLLYSCETWVVYRRHLKQLERFHQRCLRSILGTIRQPTLQTQKSWRKRIRSASKHTSIDIVFVGWATLYGLMTTAFPSSCCMENYLLAPAHSISRRNASKTVSRTH